ncbi:MAG: DegT/DnrJ/EryC1/StrS family aminotransferase [Gammaproteobacteria bacterium]|nr:DegT/DnrJ/EryC1/StrS family aminotransferase [Gammaproteobacteria bacterium]
MCPQPENIPFIDLGREYDNLEQEWLSEVRKIGTQGHFVMGENVTRLEQEIADYLGTQHGIAVASGTDALVLSLLALGIGSGDEVIVSPFSFFSSAEAISIVGATPVFADILPDTFHIDPACIEKRISKRTRAILPIHIFGAPADMGSIMRLAEASNVAVIEDCAQAFGAEYYNKKAGGLGTTGCFSFYPTKILSCYGDGGFISTDDADIAAHLRTLRNHGATDPFMHAEIGRNSRLDEIQAALLRIKLRNIDQILEARRNVAERYNERLADIVRSVPLYPENSRHAYNVYTIRTANRDRVKQYLTSHGVNVAVCYPKPLHLQSVYKQLNYQYGDLPVSEQVCREVLSLPIYPNMPTQHIDRVCELIQKTSKILQ